MVGKCISIVISVYVCNINILFQKCNSKNCFFWSITTNVRDITIFLLKRAQTYIHKEATVKQLKSLTQTLYRKNNLVFVLFLHFLTSNTPSTSTTREATAILSSCWSVAAITSTSRVESCATAAKTGFTSLLRFLIFLTRICS